MSATSQSCTDIVKASWLITGLFSQRHLNSSFPDFLGKSALPKTDYILVVNNMAVLLHQKTSMEIHANLVFSVQLRGKPW